MKKEKELKGKNLSGISAQLTDKHRLELFGDEISFFYTGRGFGGEQRLVLDEGVAEKLCELTDCYREAKGGSRPSLFDREVINKDEFVEEEDRLVKKEKAIKAEGVDDNKLKDVETKLVEHEEKLNVLNENLNTLYDYCKNNFKAIEQVFANVKEAEEKEETDKSKFAKLKI